MIVWLTLNLWGCATAGCEVTVNRCFSSVRNEDRDEIDLVICGFGHRGPCGFGGGGLGGQDFKKNLSIWKSL
jgi:hypothetical protein